MYTSFDHLSQDEIKILMDRYYGGENTKSLISEYDLKVNPSHLYRLFPVEISVDKTCKYCGEYLVRQRCSRSALVSRWTRLGDRDYYCPKCNHKPYIEYCKCNNCVEEREFFLQKEKEEVVRKQSLINKVYSHKEAIGFDSLTFTEKVYLGAFWQAFSKEKLYEISIPKNWDKRLAPGTGYLAFSMIYSLYNRNIITISPSSPIEAFYEENFPNKFIMSKVIWLINVNFTLNQLVRSDCYSNRYEEEALMLWNEIALAECIEYLMFRMKKVGLDFTPNDKLEKLIQLLLREYSVAQIYAIIWRAVAKTSNQYLKGNISKQHAVNLISYHCEDYVKIVKLNNWIIPTYLKPKELPRNVLSSFFFYKVVKFGKLGWIYPPTKISDICQV